jgi:hypothetical protein
LQRVLSTAILLGLLIATSAAFAVTERLKLVKSPVYGVFVSKTISPVCGCARGKATIAFKLRRADEVTLLIVDARRQAVATLSSAQPEPRGRSVFTWRGRTDEGTRAPDGVYQPQIHLIHQHRTILMPSRIVLDSKPPRVVSARLSRPTISPDGDHVDDSVKILYRLSERAHVLVYLGSHRIIYSHFQRPQDSVTWYGTLDQTPLKPGTYTLEVGAVDLAGNVTPKAERKPLVLTVRYIALTPRRVRVRAGARFSVRVGTDAPTYGWTLNGRHGTGRTRVLKLTAPRKAGTYALVAEENGHTARTAVTVSGA